MSTIECSWKRIYNIGLAIYQPSYCIVFLTLRFYDTTTLYIFVICPFWCINIHFFVKFFTTIIYFGICICTSYKYILFYRNYLFLMIKWTGTQRNPRVYEMDDVEEKFSSNIIKDWSSQAQGECNIAQTVVWTNKERHLWHIVFFISFIRNGLNSNTLMVYLKFIIWLTKNPKHICNTYFEIRISYIVETIIKYTIRRNWN